MYGQVYEKATNRPQFVQRHRYLHRNAIVRQQLDDCWFLFKVVHQCNLLIKHFLAAAFDQLQRKINLPAANILHAQAIVLETSVAYDTTATLSNWCSCLIDYEVNTYVSFSIPR